MDLAFMSFHNLNLDVANRLYIFKILGKEIFLNFMHEFFYCRLKNGSFVTSIPKILSLRGLKFVKHSVRCS